MIALAKPRKVSKILPKIPEYLVYEIINGQPIYYKDYEQVVKGEKTLEEIMGFSTLQGFINSYLLRQLYKKLAEDSYHILTGEAGLHLSKYTNLAGDILDKNGIVVE